MTLERTNYNGLYLYYKLQNIIQESLIYSDIHQNPSAG